MVLTEKLLFKYNLGETTMLLSSDYYKKVGGDLLTTFKLLNVGVGILAFSLLWKGFMKEETGEIIVTGTLLLFTQMAWLAVGAACMLFAYKREQALLYEQYLNQQEEMLNETK